MAACVTSVATPTAPPTWPGRPTDANRPPALMRLAEDYQELVSMQSGAAEEMEEQIKTAGRKIVAIEAEARTTAPDLR